MLICFLFLYDYFFFFKQKTAYEMRISDWSSDVCSSDLLQRLFAGAPPRGRQGMEAQSPCALRPECAVDRRAARAHPNLCEVAPSACQGKADSRARAHHRRRIAGKPAACPDRKSVV